jgi:hypothetical protein
MVDVIVVVVGAIADYFHYLMASWRERERALSLRS